MPVRSGDIDFYFSLESLWTYIGHRRIRAFAQETGALRYKPVALRPLLAETGGIPPGERHISRRRYREFELQRWCDQLGLPIRLDSPFLPATVEVADQILVIAAMSDADVEPFLTLALEAIWLNREDISDIRLLARLIEKAGLPTEILARAMSPEAAAQYRANRVEAVAANVFGLPSFVRDGEVFWGQDRLEMLYKAWSTGRPAYRSQA